MSLRGGLRCESIEMPTKQSPPKWIALLDKPIPFHGTLGGFALLATTCSSISDPKTQETLAIPASNEQ
jgi:hypothetical protein